MVCVKNAQREVFEAEFNRLSKGKPIGSKSEILSLNPYLDTEGILRVGELLQNAAISTAENQSIILSHQNKLSEIKISYFHRKTLRVSAQLTLDACERNSG